MEDVNTLRYFESNVPRYDQSTFEFAVDHLEGRARSDDSLLDIGCGDGAALALIKSRTAIRNLYGMDISERYLERTKAAVGCETILGSILDAQIVDRLHDQFDYCTLNQVLHHLIGNNRRESYRLAVSCLRNGIQLLKNGGELIIFEPAFTPAALMTLVFWIKKTFALLTSERIAIGRDWINIGQPIVSYYTPNQLLQAIRKTNFSQVQLAREFERKRLGYIISRSDFGVIVKKYNSYSLSA